MARTASNMLPLGTVAPNFELLDTISGKKVGLEQCKGSVGTLIAFICNHCPFVKHINKELAQLGKTYPEKGIGFVAISSNDIENYPEDAPNLMKQTALAEGYAFPYLYDEDQGVAKAYDAACTPDFYIFDADLKLVYRGQLDDSRPGNGIPVSGKDICDALNALVAGESVNQMQKPSIGCNIKWK
ncbi:thioredoxin family protein [Arenibacter sp. GZD96]|uniref:thioredoxin family protein n=1 Tax=Aurantibrevibacter litoralis TaxID=3106030 RepID=UPI002AFE9EAF|nr:thioredoxin family protein [Arenibacter sp. GZD-96]MEA1787059.1 thioredoxin family protein [Arenibacter sp. GZD-96]